MDWFQFNGKVISNIYVSDNSFIGLGNKTEHLLVCRRDASLYNFYREEGSLFGTIRFLKLRWEGYAQYNNTTEDVRLVYEWFFFETGDMFLNLIKAPNAAGYLGTSRINGSMNQDFAVTVTQQQYISFFHKDNSGKKFDISYSVIDFAPPFESKYLLEDKAGRFYRLMHNKAFVDSIVFKGGQCIRTGLLPGNDMRLSVSFKTSTFGNTAIFGARTDEKTDMFGMFLTDSKHITCVYGGLNITEEVDDYNNVPLTLELSAEGLKRDGITIMTFDNAEFTSSCELIIGTMNTADQLDSRYFMGTVYSLDLWQGEEQRLHLAGKWSAGDERKQKLTAAGYDYGKVQAKVNELMSKPSLKSVDEIAKEVIQGKWGNGDERKAKLTSAGYDYGKVQTRVNELMKNK